MYWSLRAISLKRALPLFAALIAAALLLMLITGFAPLRLINGARQVQEVYPGLAEGSYIRADAVEVFDSFAELGDGVSVSHVDCVVSCGDGRVIAVCLPLSMAETAGAQMQATYDWLVSGGARPSSGFEVRGELSELRGEELEAYFNWLEKNSDRLALAGAVESSSYSDYALPYVIRADMLGGVDIRAAWAVTAVTWLMAAAALTLLVLVSTGAFQLSARLYVQRNKKALKLRSPQNDYEMADKFGDTRVGQTFTWFFEDMRTVCVKNAAVAWAYPVREGAAGGGVVLYMADGRRYDLRLGSRRRAGRFLAALQESECGAVFGYSDETREKFEYWLSCRLAQRRKETAND